MATEPVLKLQCSYKFGCRKILPDTIDMWPFVLAQLSGAGPGGSNSVYPMSKFCMRCLVNNCMFT